MTSFQGCCDDKKDNGHKVFRTVPTQITLIIHSTNCNGTRVVIGLWYGKVEGKECSLNLELPDLKSHKENPFPQKIVLVLGILSQQQKTNSSKPELPASLVSAF